MFKLSLKTLKVNLSLRLLTQIALTVVSSLKVSVFMINFVGVAVLISIVVVVLFNIVAQECKAPIDKRHKNLQKNFIDKHLMNAVLPLHTKLRLPPPKHLVILFSQTLVS